jgi:hypothetical protein
MSKGTPIRSCRVDEETWQLVLATVQLRNYHSAEEPWTPANFIATAIREKVAKMDRSRGRPIRDIFVDVTLVDEHDMFSPSEVLPDPLEDNGAIA